MEQGAEGGEFHWGLLAPCPLLPAAMKLIVGLGNIGRKYEQTRHNVGFNVLDLVARRNGGNSAKQKFDGNTMDVTIGSERALLLWPNTLMNRSGQSVQAAMVFYQLPPADLLVVCDDFNLPLAKLRLRSQGSAGGQKGLEDIIKRLGSEVLIELLKEFPNSRSLDLQQRRRKDLSDAHSDVLQHQIEKGLKAIDDSFGDDDGSVGRPVKPPSPPPSGGFREPLVPRNEDVEGR